MTAVARKSFVARGGAGRGSGIMWRMRTWDLGRPPWRMSGGRRWVHLGAWCLVSGCAGSCRADGGSEWRGGSGTLRKPQGPGATPGSAHSSVLQGSALTAQRVEPT